MDYFTRAIDRELDDLLAVAPAIALDGLKGVGKTATAARRATQRWLLDEPADLEVLRAAPNFEAAAPTGTLLIDEWQRLPQVWDSIRRQVDNGASAGRFLLTGGATPRSGIDTHSGAGRILSLRMRPLALFERPGLVSSTVSLPRLLEGTAGSVTGTSQVNLTGYLEAIEDSGLPALQGVPARYRRAQLDGYLHRVIDRDLEDLGLRVRRPESLRRWLAAYAAASSTTTSYERILAAATQRGETGAKTTAINYRDYLSQLWLLDPVPGWSPSRNPFTRLQQAPKHQLADPGLAARLLNVSAKTLAGGAKAALAGPLFESLATLTVRVAAQGVGARVGHLRTGNGDHEIDLVVEGDDGQVLAIEVKLTASVEDADVRHLLWLRDRLPNDVVDLVILTTGRAAYRRTDGVAVVPLALLGI